MKLAYREFGQGQPLVILHGLFGQSDNWNTLSKNFAAEGFHVFTPDQRNHGLSPHHNEWNYEAMAKDLKEFVDEHKLHKPILLGHSMGGKTVLFFEHLFPGAAAKIIVGDTSTRAYAPHHGPVIEALHAVDFNVIKTRRQAEEAMSQHLSDFGTRQFLLKNIYWKDVANNQMDWRFNLKIIGANYNNILAPVPQFVSDVETLVVRGSNSNYILQQDLDDFGKRFPDFRLVTIEGAGHWVHAEKPKEFFNAVLEFIKV